MTKTLAVVGAGPGLGLAVAKAFGKEGFSVGLIARSPDKLDVAVAELTGLGIKAEGFPADIADRDGLLAALTGIESSLGPVDVLEYSPSPAGAPIASATRLTVANVAAQLDLNVLGAVAAVAHVLPGMVARGDGAVLLTTGASSAVPVPFLANVGIAMAGVRNWVYALNAELAETGVYAGTLTIAVPVGPGAGEGDPDKLAARYYDMYVKRDRIEEVVGELGTVNSAIAAGRRGKPAAD
jgi:short-subunit dehydrogenase